MGAGAGVQAPPRASATAVERCRQPGACEERRMAAGAAAGTWVLILSLWGAVVDGQNITARIGKSLMLKCKGIPRKQPQQQPEWKLNTGRTEAWKVLNPQEGSWDNVARILSNGSLFLPAVGIQDEGTFRCRATSRSGKEIKSNYQIRVYETPKKPTIIDPVSEIKDGVSNKVGTCVSEGGYPEGTLSWLLDGKPLIPDEKGVSVKEETVRHPETGLFTLQSELLVTLEEGETFPGSTFSCSFNPGLPRRRVLHSAPIQLSVGEPVPLEIPLLVKPEGRAVGPGGPVNLTFEAFAPQYHWIKDGMPLPESPNPVLLLSVVGPKVQGTYTCMVTHPSHRPQESHAVTISLIVCPHPGLLGLPQTLPRKRPRLAPLPSELKKGQNSQWGTHYDCPSEATEAFQKQEEPGLGTLALGLGVLGGLGAAALLIGIIMCQRRRRRKGEQRKVPENQEEEEERAELNQSGEPEAPENTAAGP